MKTAGRFLVWGLLTLALVACGARSGSRKPWNPPPYFTPEKYAEVEGMKIAYVEAGESNPNAIVFVHGFSGDLQNWWDEFEYFQKDYHVLVLDNPGHGKSEKCSKAAPCSIDLFARVVVGLMDQSKIKQAVLVGNSMGGQIVGYAAIHYPERVTKLVLSDSAGAGHYGPLALVIPLASPTTLKLLYNPKRAQYQEDGPEKNQGRSAFAKSFADTDQMRPYLVSLSQSIKSVAHTPLRKDLPKIAAPTLLIWGDDDPLVNPKTMDVFAAGIPQTTRYLVHGGGHTPQMHTPAEFNCAVEKFIQGRDLQPCHGTK